MNPNTDPFQTPTNKRSRDGTRNVHGRIVGVNGTPNTDGTRDVHGRTVGANGTPNTNNGTPSPVRPSPYQRIPLGAYHRGARRGDKGTPPTILDSPAVPHGHFTIGQSFRQPTDLLRRQSQRLAKARRKSGGKRRRFKMSKKRRF